MTPLVVQQLRPGPRASIHYADGRLAAWSREDSKPRDSGLDFFNRPEFDRHLGSNAVEMPVEFKNDMTIITSNLVALRLHEIWRQDFLPLSE